MVSTHLKNISQNGNLPQIGVKIKKVWNHHPEKKSLPRRVVLSAPYLGWFYPPRLASLRIRSEEIFLFFRSTKNLRVAKGYSLTYGEKKPKDFWFLGIFFGDPRFFGKKLLALYTYHSYVQRGLVQTVRYNPKILPMFFQCSDDALKLRCAWKPGGSSVSRSLFFEGMIDTSSSLAPFQAPACKALLVCKGLTKSVYIQMETYAETMVLPPPQWFHRQKRAHTVVCI